MVEMQISYSFLKIKRKNSPRLKMHKSVFSDTFFESKG